MKKKEEKNKFKDIESLKDLPTKRLLAYFKARRKDKIRFVNSHTCDCCGSTTWDFHPKEKYAIKAKEELDTMEMHLAKVKDLLNTRENVKK